MTGVFLQRGEYTAALDDETIYHYVPLAKVGQTVRAGDWIGEVRENWIPTKLWFPSNFREHTR
jgi:V/A-type H+-transporting ATPase subunit A